MGVVIAIDGPAGSGKSTIAKAVAAHLGFEYLDTGAMYRAVTFAVLARQVDPLDVNSVAGVARDLKIDLGPPVMVDGMDASAAIRGPEVTSLVSAVAAQPEVRAEMVRRQRELVTDMAGVVVEGRDITTVVFPDAAVKVYLTASHEERAGRRARQDAEPDTGAVGVNLARRDRIDSTRAASPLRVADSAVVIDTTGVTIDEVVEQVLALL
ncbi:MAG TPA: (d)CMP kinase [Acidimicrobiales bacterium]|nr:(d)CMP kinase [Acidimicrobiales bacterium]